MTTRQPRRGGSARGDTVDKVAKTQSAPASGANNSDTKGAREKLPIKMLNERIMVKLDGPEGERRSSGGIVIPATAEVSKRLAWGEVVAVGPNVRTMEMGDHALFNPEDRYEVEVRGDDYIILRERDVHAVASSRLGEASTGLYL